MFSGIRTSMPNGLPSAWSCIHWSSVRTDLGEWPVAPSTPKPPARLTAATTSRQWLKATRGNSIPSMPQIGDFMTSLQLGFLQGGVLGPLVVRLAVGGAPDGIDDDQAARSLVAGDACTDEGGKLGLVDDVARAG